ncbi:nucleoside hydrolase [Paenarthrobacter sp. AT5]|uniref:nucleoside hydrolase n=1 Tax=Paenarthrobacter TaxID=1742992 RepID=UPI001A98DD98|nr:MULTISPECIES: nucleoside hydrolase [Paenarthrobacter]QSZ53887.1 hypothetical protein AYX19_13400 [Paenarthrobacter ureafaciens]WOC62667.1 nucleoside hydrolase [Paenarthrobacter sp. AT5]
MALTESERPLFIGFLGPLTDMASAILLEPSIVDKDIVVIWVGGPSHDPGIVSVGSWPEFNLKNDIAAANVVFESGVTLWQIPSSVYRMVNVGYAELEAKVEPHGALGSYLVKQTREFNAQYHKVPIESRSLGDSPVVGLMLEPWGGVFRRQPPVRFSPDGHYTPSASGSEVLVLEQADTRFLLEDMYAKIAQHAEKPR